MDKVFVSYGDIILDKIYDHDLNLLKQDGGGCNWNSLYNLSCMGEKCYALGSVGNDEEGKVAVNSLKKAGVNVDNISIENIRTSVMNIILPDKNIEDNNTLHSWYSPITNEITFNFSNNISTNLPNELENKEIFIILDKFMPINFQFINNVTNKKVCLDVGSTRFFEHFTKQYLLTFFRTANYMQINENVQELLYERLSVNSEIELFSLLDLDLLVITRGKKSTTFVFKKDEVICSIDKVPKIIVSSVDTSGAGDAFFATTVREFAYSQHIDNDFIDKTFELANKSSREILSNLGSRK